jgi:hypothetical protein
MKNKIVNIIVYANEYVLGSTYEVSCDKEKKNEAKSQHCAFPPPLQ